MADRKQALPDMAFIRAKIPIVEVTTGLGLRLAGRNAAHCWRTERHQHGDRTPSISFSKNKATCYVCDPRPLSPIDLVMTHEECDLVTAVRWICVRWDVPTIAKGKKLSRPERCHFGRVGAARFPLENLVRSGLWASLSDATRSVIVTMACFGDPATGEVEISYRALARYSGKRSDSTISSVITKLEKIGLLKVTRERDGSFRKCGRYRLDWDAEGFQTVLTTSHDAIKLERDSERILRAEAKKQARILKSNPLYTRLECQQSAHSTVVERALSENQAPDSTMLKCALSDDLSLHASRISPEWQSPIFTELCFKDVSIPRVLNQRRCFVHGTNTSWWTRPDGDAICSRCHPPPTPGVSRAECSRSLS